MVFMPGDGEKFENGSSWANQPEREVACIHLSEAGVPAMRGVAEAWQRHRAGKSNMHNDTTNHNVERDSRTFAEVRRAYDHVQHMADEADSKLYVSGGSVPYLILNQDSGRLHDDLDTVCDVADMGKLRQAFQQAGVYDPSWDSLTYARDGLDYGFEAVVDGVPVGIYPFSFVDGRLTQYSYDPYSHQCKTKEFSLRELSDYVTSYETADGQTCHAMSLEYVKLTKDRAGRDKDIQDSAKIVETDLLRPEVLARIKIPEAVDDGSYQRHLTRHGL